MNQAMKRLSGIGRPLPRWEGALALVCALVPALLAVFGAATGASAALAMTATLSPPFQAEAAAPGGAVIGPCLVVLALSLAQRDGETDVRAPMFVLGLAASEEPLAFAGALAALAPWLFKQSIRSR